MTTLRANTVITDSGYPRYRILAPTWLMFDEAEGATPTFPDGMHMEQYDNSGNIHSTIDCDSAVYFTGRQTWRPRRCGGYSQHRGAALPDPAAVVGQDPP